MKLVSVVSVRCQLLANVSSGRGLTTSGARDLEADTKFIKYFLKYRGVKEVKSLYKACKNSFYIWLKMAFIKFFRYFSICD